jgi:predicted TPR repeat methyltransferase
MGMKPTLVIAALLFATFTFTLTFAGCKEDCSAAARLGDFEFSQGNFVNAVKQYEKALKADANCGIVGQKLADAKRRIAEEK